MKRYRPKYVFRADPYAGQGDALPPRGSWAEYNVLPRRSGSPRVTRSTVTQMEDRETETNGPSSSRAGSEGRGSDYFVRTAFNEAPAPVNDEETTVVMLSQCGSGPSQTSGSIPRSPEKADLSWLTDIYSEDELSQSSSSAQDQDEADEALVQGLVSHESTRKKPDSPSSGHISSPALGSDDRDVSEALMSKGKGKEGTSSHRSIGCGYLRLNEKAVDRPSPGTPSSSESSVDTPKSPETPGQKGKGKGKAGPSKSVREDDHSESTVTETQ
ncbi:hypothetical protein K488DRAFT_75037, partial [Vararia minispora EC-137]